MSTCRPTVPRSRARVRRCVVHEMRNVGLDRLHRCGWRIQQKWRTRHESRGKKIFSSFIAVIFGRHTRHRHRHRHRLVKRRVFLSLQFGNRRRTMHVASLAGAMDARGGHGPHRSTVLAGTDTVAAAAATGTCTGTLPFLQRHPALSETLLATTIPVLLALSVFNNYKYSLPGTMPGTCICTALPIVPEK